MRTDGNNRTTDAVSQSDTEQIHVLHVDNDPEAQDTTKIWLERTCDRARVESVERATDALAIFDEGGVDCIVSDYDLPGMDGIEFLRTVRERDPFIPFILFTGSGTEEVASEAISAGVTDYLRKSGPGAYEFLTSRMEHYVNTYRTEKIVGRRLRAMESAREGIAMFDEDGQFIYANQAFAEMYGYTTEELLKERWKLLFDPEDREYIENTIMPAVPHKGRWSDELVQRRKDGSPVHVSVALSYAENGTMICVAFDISEEYEAERLLDEEKERFELLIEAITEYAIFSMDPEGLVTTWNSGSERINGYHHGEIIGEKFSILYTTEDVTNGVPERQLEHARDEGPVHEKGWRVRRGGFRYWADFTLTAVNDENGAHRGFVCVLRDMTDQLERERQLQQRVRQLDEFAGILSHDLRNPLSTAKVSLDLAAEDADQATDHIARADRALDRIDALIQSLLELARKGETVSDFEQVSLVECAQLAWDTVDAPDATLDVDPDTDSIEGDAERVQTLFENLFRNAVDHGGQTVTVHVGETPEYFFVEDDGPGIPPADRAKVFDYGYTGDPDGTGFGLAIVKSIAGAHGWDVTVSESEMGGARFEFAGVDGFETDDV
ncbi:PAS domain S-box protein [Haloarchaeobius sp. HME9146]|uniref:hybrid sensor histidine kinase/response regulator n=1 Tax=Haloarchaeobius sp. HME9146 TaxID=2978732 RepID=UPI0021BEB60C|nr:PAS domain S-box protein [Haloarchaeobius sp. HME9146]MCT9098294.1 PAS domain S-box protein [Haloarchaeobius sp. HME9146]